jgi:hypothetical protein
MARNGTGHRPVGLIDKLEATRHAMRAFRRSRCLLQTVLAVLILAGFLACADWLWVLSAGVRAGGLLVLSGVAVLLLSRLLVSGREPGRRHAAEEVETAFPQLGQRVRTALEYSEPAPDTTPAWPALVDALATDTERRTSQLDFRDLIPWRSLWPLALALLGLVALFAALLAWYPEWRVAAARLFLLPATYTHLQVKPGDQDLRLGNDLTIAADVTGRPVDAIGLRYRLAGEEDWTEVALAPPDLDPTAAQKLAGTFETTLQDCQSDLDYRVVAGPVESPLYHVRILRPLVLKKFQATVQPPAYTRRPAAVVREGNFRVIAGSRVGFRLTLDREPRTARLVFHPLGDTPPLALRTDGPVLTGEMPAVRKELEYEVFAEDGDGMRLDAGRFHIAVQPDRKPAVRFLKPPDPIEVTPTTEVHLRIAAEDDFGLSKVGIVYQIGARPKKTLYLDRDPKQPASLRAEATLALEDHRVSFQDGVTYFAFAEDNHPDRPQRTTTELRFIDIRPYKRAYQLLKTGGS